MREKEAGEFLVLRITVMLLSGALRFIHVGTQNITYEIQVKSEGFADYTEYMV